MIKDFLKNNIRKLIFFCLVIVFIVTMIPIIEISAYNFPSADDFSSSMPVKTALENGEGFFGALDGIFNYVKSNYFSWQGTFFGLFIMALNPLGYYPKGITIHPVVLVLLLVFGITFFVRSFTKVCLKDVDRFSAYSVGLTLSIYCVQFVPRAVDAFFWYTGGFLYTGVFSLSLILFGAVIRTIKTQNNIILKLTLCSVFAFLLSSGNYINSVLNTMVLFFIAVYAFTVKNKTQYKSAFKRSVIIFASHMIGFLITVLAPGNFARGSLTEAQGDGTFISDVVVRSFKLMFETALMWTGLPLILLCALLVPLFYTIVKKQDFKFRYPLLFIGVFFVCVTALWSPYLFPYIGVYIAFDTALRVTNLLFYSYIFFVIASVYYVVGYLYNYLHAMFEGESFSFAEIQKIIAKKSVKKILCLWYGAILVMVVAWFVVSSPLGLTSYIAQRDLSDGTALAYNAEQQAFFDQLNDPETQHVVIDDFTVFPYLLWSYESNTKPAHWTHWLPFIQNYYGKNEISVN